MRILVFAALACALPPVAQAQDEPDGWMPVRPAPAFAGDHNPVQLGGGTLFDPSVDEAGWTTRQPYATEPFPEAAFDPALTTEPVYQAPDVPPYFEHTPVEPGIPENLGDYAPELAPGQELLVIPPQPGEGSPRAADPGPSIAPIRSTTTWLPGDGDDLGWVDLDLFAMRVAVGEIADGQASITPGFRMHFIDGPSRTDLPPRLYDVYAEFRYMRQLSQQLGIEVAVTPSWFSDGDNTSSDAFRMVSRVLGFYAVSVETQYVFGVVYLDREDIRALPAIGVIHATEDARWELVFPRPRVAVRIDPAAERWAYIAGEFGGGSWAVERSNRQDDIATYSDWRLIFGLETKRPDKTGSFAEVGFVFNRELEYESQRGDYDPDATAMFRVGSSY